MLHYLTPFLITTRIKRVSNSYIHTHDKHNFYQYFYFYFFKKRAIGTYGKSDYYNTIKSTPYQNNPLSFTKARGTVCTISVVTATRTPYNDYVLQTCA